MHHANIYLVVKIAKFLQDNNIREKSYSFDWVITMSLETINLILANDNFTEKYMKNIKDYTNSKVANRFGAGKSVENLLYVSENYKGLIFRHIDFINNKDEYETINRIYERLKNDSRPIKFIRRLHNGNVNKRLISCDVNLPYKLNDMNYKLFLYLDVLQRWIAAKLFLILELHELISFLP